MKNKKRNSGITLVALIITIIVLLILAGVAVSIGTNRDNMFEKANETKTEWNEKSAQEDNIVNEIFSMINPKTEAVISKELTTNNGNGFVGYFADFDGNPGVDGKYM